jgi:hypothetical protein
VNRPTTDQERVALVHAGATAALEALKGELDNARDAAEKYPDTFDGLFWGDHEDYVNAAYEQLGYCINLLQPFDRELSELDKLWDMPREELENGVHDEMSFVYGYADHRSPISDLMQANRRESDDG